MDPVVKRFLLKTDSMIIYFQVTAAELWWSETSSSDGQLLGSWAQVRLNVVSPLLFTTMWSRPFLGFSKPFNILDQGHSLSITPSVNQWEDKIFIIFYHWKTKKLILCIFYLNLIHVDEFQAFNWSVNPNSMGVWL